MERNKEIHDVAWNLLNEKGLNLSEKMRVRSAFIEWSGYKDEHPHIDRTYKKGNIEYYHSTHEIIKNLMFKTENEVVLANAIYLNMDKSCDVNEFRQIFKFTCRLIGINSDWS